MDMVDAKEGMLVSCQSTDGTINVGRITRTTWARPRSPGKSGSPAVPLILVRHQGDGLERTYHHTRVSPVATNGDSAEAYMIGDG